MKRILTIVTVLFSICSNAQIKMPAPSSTQTIIQEFGLGKIELTYSRPNLKNRSVFKENSDLAPLNKLWRFGANAATKIRFTDQVTIGGKLLDTGSYVLYAIPGKDYWDIIINKGLSNWGADGYKEAEDVVRVKLKSEKQNNTVESFTLQFASIQAETCELQMYWGNSIVTIPISTNVKPRLKAQIEKELAADKVNPSVYQVAANFYFDWDKDLDKALINATNATKATPNGYWLFLLKAKIEKAKGDKIAAKASAEKCIEIATIAKNDDYVRQANDLIKKL